MVKVNAVFKNLIPPLSTDEYSALEASILKEGVREAIILWGDFIVDGHNRYEIATRHGLTFQTISKDFASEDDVIVWMIDNQLARRNLSEYVKFELTATQKEALERIGLKKMQDGGGDKKSEEARSGLSIVDKPDLAKNQNWAEYSSAIANKDELIASHKASVESTHQQQPSPIVKPAVVIPEPQPKKVITPHNTQKEIAKTLGWSTGKVAMADVVAKKADDQTKEKLRAGEMSINAAYKEVKAVEKREERATRAEAPPLPKSSDGRYDVIYADPPWRYDFSTTDNRKIENHYPTMAIEDICALGVPDMCADDCVLFLWGTNPKLKEALAVIDAWGFEYKTNMVWVKNQIGMGYYARQQHELLLIATKGKPPVPFPENRPNSAFLSPRENHSAKPIEYYDMISKMYPNARKIELFSRKQVDGWDRWGNE